MADVARFPETAAEDEEFFRRYGPWEPLTIAEAKELFDPIGVLC